MCDGKEKLSFSLLTHFSSRLLSSGEGLSSKFVRPIKTTIHFPQPKLFALMTESPWIQVLWVLCLGSHHSVPWLATEVSGLQHILIFNSTQFKFNLFLCLVWVKECRRCGAHSSKGPWSQYSAVCVLKVSRRQGHHKALKWSLTLMPDGGRCLNIYVPVEGKSDNSGGLGVQDPRSDSTRFSGLWEMSRGTGQLLY